RFIFVDELTCIGCTHCKHVAPKTFMLEDDYGRARVFSQAGDDQEMIDEAIDCCPVECIHTVSHTELVRLEGYR
ncbi:4Fe-4S single cluster domain-containing protein, partial [Pavlovales sp. CCMP2436]